MKESQFANALMYASADENKRLGAFLVGSPMVSQRSSAEYINLRTIHSISGEILEAKNNDLPLFTVKLETFNTTYNAEVRYEVNEELDIVSVKVKGIDILPLIPLDDLNGLLKLIEDHLSEERAMMLHDIKESMQQE